jgi:hypothetical protein
MFYEVKIQSTRMNSKTFELFARSCVKVKVNDETKREER